MPGAGIAGILMSGLLLSSSPTEVPMVPSRPRSPPHRMPNRAPRARRRPRRTPPPEHRQTRPRRPTRQQPGRRSWVVAGIVTTLLGLMLVVAGPAGSEVTTTTRGRATRSAMAWCRPRCRGRPDRGRDQRVPESRGVPDRTLVLTFDDGPDPRWTPEVLAVLRKHQVPGTFFVVGSMAARHPELVRAIHRYVSVFTDFDSEDWARPGVDAIVRNATRRQPARQRRRPLSRAGAGRRDRRVPGRGVVPWTLVVVGAGGFGWTGGAARFVTTTVLVAAAVLAFGLVEDLAAGRRPRLLPALVRPGDPAPPDRLGEEVAAVRNRDW